MDDLGIEVPKVYQYGGTSISDFSVSEIEAEEFTAESTLTPSFKTYIKAVESAENSFNEGEHIEASKIGNQAQIPSSAMYVPEKPQLKVIYSKEGSAPCFEAGLEVLEVPAEPMEPIVIPEPSTEPVKRFYAKKRGRKKAERDEIDLIELWSQGLPEKTIFQTLESWQMAERRRF